MWSKQADMRNANMTSFKNKITNRKQKHSKPSSTDLMGDNNVVVEEAETTLRTPAKKQNKSGKHRNRGNKNKTGGAVDVVDHCKGGQEEGGDVCGGKNHHVVIGEGGGGGVVIIGNNTTVKMTQSNKVDGVDDQELADVVLRQNVVNPGIIEQNLKNTNLKRYSDSFVIENNTDVVICDDLTKKKEKGRRFSDLFRHGTLKTTNSVENLGNIIENSHTAKGNTNKNSMDSKTSKRNKKSSQGNEKYTTISDKKHDKSITNLMKSNNIDNNSNSSYLKRVKSKIYSNKNKDDGGGGGGGGGGVGGSILPSKNSIKKKSFEKIPEDESEPQLRKSLIDFRLIRQTSNLERIRCKTFGVTKSSSNTGIADLIVDGDGKKPILTKAKSSSAINLNLLRMRRNRILEQVKERRCKDVLDEFDFIAFGGGNGRIFDKFGGSQRLMPVADSEGQHADIGENKPSQPVSRSGSDRRPDVLREEISKNQDCTISSDHGHDKLENDATTPDSTASFPSTANKKRTSSNINRSESVKEQSEKRKQRRNISDPSHNTTSGDVELDQAPLSNTDSGSSSNSSISYNGRLSESPSNSVDVVAADTQNASDWESDIEMEPVIWQNLFPEEKLRNLQPHEKKRQDVISELFHTEGTHVRNLKVLFEIFYKSLLESQTLKPDELALIFPNMEEVLSVHTQFNKEMKRKRREDPVVNNLGDMLVGLFGGSSGECLQKASAMFCERQQLALEFIKERRKRDSKFDSILLECEKKPHCRRLPLQGIVPTQMQRLSKYPLLLERLISSVEIDTTSDGVQEELAKLRRAHHHSKEILNYVNEAAKLALNHARLEDIQRHLDTSNFERSEHSIVQEFRTIDLTRYKLIIEGNMQLRRPGKALVPVHILLLEEAVIILHKEGDRFLLKFFQSGSSAQPQPFSPIIKMSTLLVRTNAVCKNALFLVNTSTNNSQMYDLLAEDDAKREVWFKHFSDAANAYNRREGKTKRPEPPPDSDESETVQDLPVVRDVAERAEAVGGQDENPTVDISEDEEQHFSDAQDERNVETKEPPCIDSSEGGGVQTKITADDWPLIQPSQVHTEIAPVHTAESRLTPLEQIRRKDEEVRRALEDKESLVADLLSIPREHYQHIADMASEEHDSNCSKDLSERVLASIYQNDQLHLLVNEALNVTETATVLASGGKHASCQSQELLSTVSAPPSVPAYRVRDIATLLSSQLTTLLSEVKQVEEDRERLRKEVSRLRERLHEQHFLHGPHHEHSISSSTLPPETLDLECIKENPTGKES